jgi:hypothetical protein
LVKISVFVTRWDCRALAPSLVRFVIRLITIFIIIIIVTIITIVATWDTD